jgi:hypothetical protein
MRIEVARLDFLILRTKEDFEHGHPPETLWSRRETRSTPSPPEDGCVLSGRRHVGARGRCSPFPAEVRRGNISGATRTPVVNLKG